MDILVTGHTGFIGSAIRTACEKRDSRVHGVSRREGVDLEQPKALDGTVECEQIVHAAGLIGPAESWNSPEAFYRSNVLSTLTVCERARETGARVIYLSSYLYGIPRSNPIDEGHPVVCTNPYARSKHAAEVLCEAYAADYGVEVTILRPFNVFGPQQSEQQLIPHLILQATSGSKISVASLTPRRDYLWVHDLADAVVSTLTMRQEESVEVFNVGFGVSYSVDEIIQEVTRITGDCEVLCSEPRWVDRIPDCVCDSTKLRLRTGWKPKVSIRDGLEQLIGSSSHPS